MRRRKRTRLRREIRIERRLHRMRLNQLTIQLLNNRARAHTLMNTHTMLLRQSQQLLKISLHIHAATQRLRQSITHRHHTPRTRHIRHHALARSLTTQRQRHRTKHRLSGILNQTLRQLAHLHIIRIRTIRLKHRKLRIMGRISTLITEITTQLIHRTATAHHQTLQVQLRRNTQRQILTIRIDIRAERTRARATVHRMQNRGLHLKETLRIQPGTQCLNDRGTQTQILHLIRMHQQVRGTATQTRLRVGKGVEGDGVQALRRHVPGGGNQRLGTVTARPVGAPHGDDVTGIQVAGGEAQRALAHQAAFHDDLQGFTPFNQSCKEDFTMVAKRANTTRNHEFRIWNIFRREYTQGILHAQHRDVMTALLTTQRIRLHARRTQRIQMAQTVLSLIATRHLRKLFHSSELHLAKSLQLICRKNLLLILQTTRRQIR